MKKKKAELLVMCLFLFGGNRQVAFTVEKHEQFTPNGREPSSLVLTVKYWRYFPKREQGLKVQVVCS